MNQPLARGILLTGLFVASCEGSPAVPIAPTWSDVEPLLRGQCNHCHGANAAQAATRGGAVYRFDFFDRSESVCGEASAGMTTPAVAGASARLIKESLTTAPGERALMPPAPGPRLYDWQRDTILRWADKPIRGPVPPSNRAPGLKVAGFPAAVADRLELTVVVEDPDGEPVMGVIKAGGETIRMDRSGSFAFAIDTRSWPPGPQTVEAVLCDGWIKARYELGTVIKR